MANKEQLEKSGERLSPAERTQAFFSQNFDNLADQLLQRQVISIVDGTQQQIQITGVTPFNRERNTTGPYKPVLTMENGEVYPCPVEGSRIPLVVASENGESGACVQIKQALLIDPLTGKARRNKTQKEIVEHLGLSGFNRHTERAYLAFADDTDTLHLLRVARSDAESEIKGSELTLNEPKKIPSTKANRLLKAVFDAGQ